MTTAPSAADGVQRAAGSGLGAAGSGPCVVTVGETMALTIILSWTAAPPGYSIFDSGATFASKIALGSAEFNNNLQVGAYISAGLVLFIITFAVNAIARWIESAAGAKGKS